MVTARPILMSGPMVRACLAGTKTQTRRTIREARDIGARCTDEVRPFGDGSYYICAHDGTHMIGEFRCPYGQPGDLLIPAIKLRGYQGKYAAGIDGRIYSRARGSWRPLKEWRQAKGYQTVTLMGANGRKHTRTLHRLLCEAFYGPAPTDAHQVRHLDGNPENGRLSNLAWGTQEENWLDRKVHGNGIEGEKHHAAKLSDGERQHIRWAVSRGLCSQRHAARTLGLSQGAISSICIGKSMQPVSQAVPSGRIGELTLRITDVWPERLQQISEADAEAEGVWSVFDQGAARTPGTALGCFPYLWDGINAYRAPWASSPWVFALSFETVLANVDHVMKEAA